MLAIDTNLIVRYLAADHPKQSAQAKALIDSEEILVCTTVLLEAEWVLRSVYGFAAKDLVRAFRAFAGLPRVTVEDPARLARALDWMEDGMDFADALHLSGAQDCDAFATFDRHLVRAAGKLGGIKVRAV
jgi:predicted nucleic acid-binding protein